MKPCTRCSAPATHVQDTPHLIPATRHLCARCAERIDAVYDWQIAQITRRRPRPIAQAALDLGGVA